MCQANNLSYSGMDRHVKSFLFRDVQPCAAGKYMCQANTVTFPIQEWTATLNLSYSEMYSQRILEKYTCQANNLSYSGMDCYVKSFLFRDVPPRAAGKYMCQAKIIFLVQGCTLYSHVM
jgi:hypothetical protein